VPIGVTVVIGVPAVVDRIDESRAAAAVVAGVDDAQLVARLVHALQQERQLSLAYLASPAVQRSALVAQHSSTVEQYVRARTAVAGPGAADVRERLELLGGLAEHRAAVLTRTASAQAVWSTYGDAIAGLLDALRLTQQPGADATGLRHTQALDALLREQEQASQAGAALVYSFVDPAGAPQRARQAQLLGASLRQRFAEVAQPSQVDLWQQTFSGEPSARAERLVADLAAQRSPAATLAESLSLAEHEAQLRRLVREHLGHEIATGAATRAAQARTGAVVMGSVTAGLLLVIVLLGVTVNRSVSRPLRRVTVAATAIADLAGREMIRTSLADETDDRPPRLAALTLRSDDEIGELASAFNRVQATAALLMEQQVSTRRNVATMFGNIAHRTQSLVARQLVAIDELERNERDEQRLASLYRLDHLTARLRRSADSLLVIAGARDDSRMTVPRPLADVIRSAMAEIEGYQSVTLGRVDRLVLTAAVVPDLTLLLAELLENATSFSPPGAAVTVSAVQTADGDCAIQVVDHGMGMTPERLQQENQRLVSTERLDVAPTTVLGLFVVGRIARRYGIGVRLSTTPGGGVTADVTVPAALLLPDEEDAPFALDRGVPERSVPDRGGRGVPERALPESSARDLVARNGIGPPAWFEPTSPGLPVMPPSPNGHVPAAAPSTRGGLRRREPGRSLAESRVPEARRPAPAETVRPGMVDPEAERAALAAFADGDARGQAHGGGAPRHEAPRQETYRREMPSGRAPGYGTPGYQAPRHGYDAPSGAAPGYGASGFAAPDDQAGRHGLRRRVPGAHLGADVRPAPGRHRPPAERPVPMVDPDAEREQMAGYLDGIARAETPFGEPPSRTTWQYGSDPWSR